MRVWLLGLLLLPAFVSVARGDAPRQISGAAYRAEEARLSGLVAACAKDAGACDEKAVGEDVTVADGGTVATVRWDWLRAVLKETRDAAAAKDGRDEKMAAAREDLAAAGARLREDAGAGESADGALPEPGEARRRANAVLSGKEFQLVEGRSYLQEKLAAFFLFLDEVFGRVAGVLPQSALFGQVLEWGVLGAAAAGLLLWAWRVNQRGRLELAARMEGGERVWQEEVEAWAARAEAEAGKGDWREAVHCLYWSAIVMGEGRGLWRQNRARTPREYVKLLEPGTARQASLRALTGVFERIWYGLRPASEGDYRQARGLVEELRAG